MSEQVERLIAAVRKRGSDARDLRDAVHEASHGLRLKMHLDTWDREEIHAACMDLRPGDVYVEELMARAVEQVVCDRLGQPAGPVKEWAHITWMEAFKNGLDMGNHVEEHIVLYMGKPEVAKLADEIIALAEQLPLTKDHLMVIFSTWSQHTRSETSKPHGRPT
jgi:hypothetical protein